MTARLAPGDDAPEFTLPTADGTQFSSHQLRGRKAILYFYPAAGTPGCTAQACDFRDSLGSLATAGYQVLGVSPDRPDALRQFRDQQQLTFPLLADPEHRVHRAFGAVAERTVEGHTRDDVLRSTFVLDEHGRVQQALYDVAARGHVVELRGLLGLDAAPA